MASLALATSACDEEKEEPKVKQAPEPEPEPEPLPKIAPRLQIDEMGPMVGYAVTVVIQPSHQGHRVDQPNANGDYRRYVASLPGPKIVVVQDLDKPQVIGSLWGEVNAAYADVMGEHRPARAIVPVQSFREPFLVEIVATAALGR